MRRSLLDPRHCSSRSCLDVVCPDQTCEVVNVPSVRACAQENAAQASWVLVAKHGIPFSLLSPRAITANAMAPLHSCALRAKSNGRRSSFFCSVRRVTSWAPLAELLKTASTDLATPLVPREVIGRRTTATVQRRGNLRAQQRLPVQLSLRAG